MNNLLEQEISERKCVWSCISRIEESIIKCDYREAKLTAVDLLNSIRELERLEEAKENNRNLARMVHQLQAKGIKIEKVARSI
ncbi:hypothetical protein [Bacillus sp. REN10]|uniref:hypothetical protein n=1 Tax=Bacillus sp. REN10 TaxID=2782541 RepID=UPI00193BFB6C|nr:hypothetical protein [Bacillus sp. REN10]